MTASGDAHRKLVITVLIALLAVLGVNLIVLVVFVLAVLARRRWVSHHDGAFKGIARVVDGELHGLGHRSRHGYGHWVRNVLIWTPAPLYLRNAIIGIDQVEGTHKAKGKIRRLGDHPSVVTLAAGHAQIELTVQAKDQPLVAAPFTDTPASATPPTSRRA
jgi:hypothetical protein